MSPPIRENDIIEACRALFGDEARLGREFLRYLQPSGAKSAFRRLAKQTHPDLYPADDPATREQRAASFRSILHAYELLCTFLSQREAAAPAADPPLHDYHADPARASESAQPRNAHFYTGPVPSRPLQIGIYLYYRGRIPYHALIEALVWQRRQRPAIGALARRWGWLNEAAVRSVFTSRQAAGRFGEKAVRLGLLRPHQVQTLLAYQHSRQQRLGLFFVEQGYLRTAELEKLALELKVHNQRFRAAGL